MPRADLVFFDAGGGHRNAAKALDLVLRRHTAWQPSLVNLQEVLDPIDLMRKLTGVRLEDAYNIMLKRNWTRGASHLLRLLHSIIRYYHRDQVRLLVDYWRKSRPDLVVSLIPQFNRALHESLREAIPSAPLVTVLTDWADYPPHFWMERQDQFFICGSSRAVEQALELRIAPERVYQTSGMILHPRFYDPINFDREAERRRLGLDPKLPTGLVLFGGHGSKAMLEIARGLDKSKRDLQLIFVCGRNEALATALRTGARRLRRLVVGFTTEVPYYMFLSDFFIGKPGPGSLSEALFMKIPVIVELNSRTLPQERYNAEWIRQKQLGMVVASFRHIDRAIDEFLCPVGYARYRAHAAALENNAVFEIVEILRDILQAGTGAPEKSALRSENVLSSFRLLQ